MGLSLNEEEIHANRAMVPGAPSHGQLVGMNFQSLVVTWESAEQRLSKESGKSSCVRIRTEKKKIGLRLKSIDNGAFVQLIQA